jgi:hypothetical protein
MTTMAKMPFLAGLAVGYVLGAKAGRRHYEQIKDHATGLWASEPVQERVGQVRATIQDQAPVALARLGERARALTEH